MSNIPSLEEIIALAKRRGFVYPTSTIYGGLANSYDYGPLGAQLIRNIRNLWWAEFIEKRKDMVGLDSQILLHPKTWEASGHVTAFNDPLVEDKVTHKRYRADHLIKAWQKSSLKNAQNDVENMTIADMTAFILKHKILSPDGNEITQPKAFNLLFESAIGAVGGDKGKVYLRGETAQGIFCDFKHILDTMRVKLPFGVGQIGKSFRNEITTGQFIFRTLELEQAEIEYFFDPAETSWQELMESWKQALWNFITKALGVSEENLRWRRHSDKERSFYSKDTYDLEYNFSFGWGELWGLAYRTDYDLNQHMKFSGESLEYTNALTGKKIVPHVIEPAVGINRIFLMLLTEGFFRDQEKKRLILKFTPNVAPQKIAIFPLVKNKPEIVAKADEVFEMFRSKYTCGWDDRGNIGKRYLYQDEIGTPFCITIDYQTLEDQTVTIRDRDTTKQERVEINQLETYLNNKFNLASK